MVGSQVVVVGSQIAVVDSQVAVVGSQVAVVDSQVAVLFLIVWVVFLVLAIYAVITMSQAGVFLSSSSTATTFILGDRPVLFLSLTLVISLFCSIIFAVFWICIIRRNAAALVKLLFIVASLFWIVSGIILVVITGKFIFGLVIAIAPPLICAFIYWCLSNRIGITELYIQGGIGMLSKTNGVFSYTVCMAFLGAIFAILMQFVYVTFQIMVSYCSDDEHASLKAGFQAARFATVVVLFFTINVLRYASHFVISSVVASNYLDADNPARISSAIKNAFGKSFGSICFAAFVITVIQILEYIVSRENENMKESGKSGMLTALAKCILDYFGEIIEFANKYSLIYVAIYGDSYWEAVKRAFRTFKIKGISMILTDIIVDWVAIIPVLSSAIVGGAVNYFIAYLLYGDNFEYYPHLIGLICGFVTALIVVGTILETIASATSTFLILVTEFPEEMKNSNPDVFEKLNALYRKKQNQNKVPQIFK